jgi:hypothetical protein
LIFSWQRLFNKKARLISRKARKRTYLAPKRALFSPSSVKAAWAAGQGRQQFQGIPSVIKCSSNNPCPPAQKVTRSIGMKAGQKGGQELGRVGQEEHVMASPGREAEVNADTEWLDRASCHLSMSDGHVL